jgi:mono/diheme cytochrome c family protein
MDQSMTNPTAASPGRLAMRKGLRWITLGLGGGLGLLLVAGVGLYGWASLRLNQSYTVQPEAVVIPGDAAALERGRHWVSVSCAACHGEDLAGTVIFDDPALGHIEAPNLTRGQGGVGGDYGDGDWVRAVRHGVGRGGRPTLVMPADAFYYLGDEDLGAIIAYVKSVPPVDRASGGYRLTPLGHLLLAAGAFGQILDAEAIDHTGPRPVAPAPGANAVYGEYIVRVLECRTCHGPELTGGKDPNPDAPPGPNLTQSGELGGWTEADFIAAVRTGVTPSGRLLSEYMPWKYFGRMSDDELSAVWLYLQTLSGGETP